MRPLPSTTFDNISREDKTSMRFQRIPVIDPVSELTLSNLLIILYGLLLPGFVGAQFSRHELRHARRRLNAARAPSSSARVRRESTSSTVRAIFFGTAQTTSAPIYR